MDVDGTRARVALMPGVGRSSLMAGSVVFADRLQSSHAGVRFALLTKRNLRRVRARLGAMQWKLAWLFALSHTSKPLSSLQSSFYPECFILSPSPHFSPLFLHVDTSHSIPLLSQFHRFLFPSGDLYLFHGSVVLLPGICYYSSFQLFLTLLKSVVTDCCCCCYSRRISLPPPPPPPPRCYPLDSHDSTLAEEERLF